MENKQQQVLEYLKKHQKPKSEDIKKALGLNDNSLRHYLIQLKNEGEIKWK